MTEHTPRFVVLNILDRPCHVCGAMLPFMTASPDDPPGATTHLPDTTPHLPVVVETPDDVPDGWGYAPLDEYPSLCMCARTYNLSDAFRARRAGRDE